MLEQIINLDLLTFYFINKTLANSVTSFAMPVITSATTWAPVISFFMIYQFFKGGEKGKLCIAALILGVIICDQLSSSLIKSLVMRPRPCHVLNDINLLVKCGAGKSFPSSHAANSMMVVTVISLFFRQHKYWLPWLAVIVGISRIFVGVHYPLDVFCGLIIGALVSWFVYWLVNKIFISYIKPRLRKVS